MHGGTTTQVDARADTRMTLGQILRSERRPVGEVLLDAVHAADAITRDLTVRVSAGDTDVETLTRFIEALTRSAKLAKVALDAGVMQAVVAQRVGEGRGRVKLTEDLPDGRVGGVCLEFGDGPVREPAGGGRDLDRQRQHVREPGRAQPRRMLGLAGGVDRDPGRRQGQVAVSEPAQARRGLVGHLDER
jgi:hypothetical protein